MKEHAMKFETQHLITYTTLIRQRDDLATALDAARQSRQEAQGLQRNWLGSAKYKAGWEAFNAKAVTPDKKMEYADYLARDTVRFANQLKTANENIAIFEKALGNKESLLKSLLSDQPALATLSFDAALSIISGDPSSDPLPIERLAHAESSEQVNTENVERVASNAS